MDRPCAADTAPMTRRLAGASAPSASERVRPALPLRWGVALVAIAVLVSFGAVALLTMSASSSVGAAESRLLVASAAREQISRGVATLEQARGDLVSALSTGIGGTSIVTNINDEIGEAHETIDGVTGLDLPGYLADSAESLYETAERIVGVLDVSLSRLSGGDPAAAKVSLLELRRAGSDLQAAWEEADGAFAVEVDAAQVGVEEARTDAATRVIVGAAMAALLVFGVGLFVARSVQRRLHAIGNVAKRVGDGDLEARAPIRAHDEIGRIAQALNAAVTVQRDLVERLETEADRVRFTGAVSEAFEMVDREAEAYEVVEHAFARILPGRPAEFLLADSSRAHLRTAASTEDPAPPSCPVAAPYDCVAVRRGSAVVFEDSQEINACPKLRDRDCGPCSAACVPVSFMGRALGVLHATAPTDAAWDPEKVALLSQVASLAGSRIGTIRTFERTQVQASTDGLTGLANRRAFETEARRVLQGEQPVTAALLDLDHFKLLNDTYGHEAGDRALRAFARILASGVRDGDQVARVGGEEFAVLLPHTGVESARLVFDRIRSRLGETGSGDAPPVTVSVGLVARERGDSLDDLLRYADRALYRAKENGRNRVEVAGPEDRAAPSTVAAEDRWLPVAVDEEDVDGPAGGGDRDAGRDEVLAPSGRLSPFTEAAIQDQDRSPDDRR